MHLIFQCFEEALHHGVHTGIAEEYEFSIDTVEVMEDQVQIFVEVPPGYSPAQVVQILKSVSVGEVFKKSPKLRKQLRAGQFWSSAPRQAEG